MIFDGIKTLVYYLHFNNQSIDYSERRLRVIRFG